MSYPGQVPAHLTEVEREFIRRPTRGAAAALLRGIRDGQPIDMKSLVLYLVEILVAQEQRIEVLETTLATQKGDATT